MGSGVTGVVIVIVGDVGSVRRTVAIIANIAITRCCPIAIVVITTSSLVLLIMLFAV